MNSVRKKFRRKKVKKRKMQNAVWAAGTGLGRHNTTHYRGESVPSPIMDTAAAVLMNCLLPVNVQRQSGGFNFGFIE